MGIQIVTFGIIFSVISNQLSVISGECYSSYLHGEIGSFPFGESVVNTKLGYTSSLRETL
ncbi:hypothetical protein [Microcystis panniformis]|uniref:Uncharacterized protein n=1 Tax=Microcystis panniformis FACHB-1757 TaxID=1638788 RepID=A0A0K1RV57_9CHRO|nr:hypothetical protein [Microcystis panniformis]AKV65787.1 hypothetical protein VL20_571 [Microcystis panniformis FACHB-1757]